MPALERTLRTLRTLRGGASLAAASRSPAPRGVLARWRAFGGSSAAAALASPSWDALRAALDATPADASLASLVTSSSLRRDEYLHPSGVATFWLLRHADTDPDAIAFDPACDLGVGGNADVLAAVAQQDAILYGARSRPGVPLGLASSLVAAAIAKLPRGDASKSPVALVPLPRMCEWARDGERWSDDDPALVAAGEEAIECAKAIALGKPRPGHSVLGQGTFRAGERAWMRLCEMHMEEDEEVAREMATFKGAMRGAFAPAHMADTDPEYIALAGGAMAVLKQ